jgi:GTP pyrophosphokinase
MYVIDEEREEREIGQKYEELMAACREVKQLTPQEEEDILRAFTVAKKAHSGTRRKSGEPYIFHPLAVATIAVKEVGLGPVAVICALLHDVVEDTEVTIDNIRILFGDRVATIVDGVTKIEDVIELHQSESKQAENYRKILLSMCGDVYVIFLKLCDRLHNMRTLDSMKDTKKLAISSETQFIYIPLAHRLGLYNIKTELEELVMKYTNPDDYAAIEAELAKKAGSEQKIRECFTIPICQYLDAAGIHYTIVSRIKSVYSCWKKMQKKGIPFNEIYDLYAMRIILDVERNEGMTDAEFRDKESAECFRVYSIINSHYVSKPDRMRDWIHHPKTNGYESLHGTFSTTAEQWVEVQIRTKRMDNIAEKGMAAHFLYKEAHPDERIENNPVEEWLQSIRSTFENTEKSAIDQVQEFKESLYTNEIYVFTPKGTVVKLPSHSTVLDFAFAIHTDIGIHCIGAKVNTKVVPVGFVLHSGQQVQVLTSKKSFPQADWLSIAHTSHAKERIKDFLHEQKKGYHDKGEEKLQAIANMLGLRNNPDTWAQLKRYFDIASDVELYYQIASGAIDEQDIAKCFGKARIEPNMMFLGPYKELFEHSDVNENSGAVVTNTQADLSHSFILDHEYEQFTAEPASCCKPVQGDTVVGIVSGSKIKVHRTNCKVAMDEMASHENHIVRAKWRQGEKVTFLSGLTLTAIDRRGLLQDLTRVVSEEMDLNMRAITLEASEGIVHGIIMLYVNNLDGLHRLIEKIQSIDGVEDTRRM